MSVPLRLAVAVLIVLFAAGTARANYEETERRLKAVGVDAELRKRIHEAIDRGVEHLRSRQGTSGAFFPRNQQVYAYSEDQVTPLSALALRHAGTPSAMESFERAMKQLFPREDRGIPVLSRETYVAGITLMLLMADRSHLEVGRRIAALIADARDVKTGWWGYLIGRARLEATFPDTKNLSTTQFAALGLWAGDRIGAETDRRVWRAHLASLLRLQVTRDSRYLRGSWPYYALPNEGGYPTGTFMGIANLLLAEQALAKELKTEPALREELRAAKKLGLAALERDGANVLEGKARLSPVWLCYTLYALEKACIFANVERLGDLPWYQRGAEILDTLSLVGTAWAGLRPDLGAGADSDFEAAAREWREDAEDLLAAAVALPTRTAGPDRRAVNLAAARAIGRTSPRGGRLLAAVLEKRTFQAMGDPDGLFYEAAFASLADIGSTAGFEWLREEAVTGDMRPDGVVRTRAALVAIRQFENVPGAERLATVHRLVRVLAPVERSLEPAAAKIWLSLRDEAIETLRHLTRDPVTNRAATGERGLLLTVEEYGKWLRDHHDPTEPPWLDP